MSVLTKIALDTNFIIQLCKNEDLLNVVVCRLSNPKAPAKMFIQLRNIEEFSKKASEEELQQFERLKAICEINHERLSTIGVSTIGGPDRLSGATYESLAKDYDVKEYKDSGTKKDPSEWIVSKQGDATIISFASEKNCKFIVTDDQSLQKKLTSDKQYPQPLASHEFLSKYVFSSTSEWSLADYFTTNSIRYDYERKWGDKYPDFTTYYDQAKSSVLAIFDVKDFDYTDVEKKALKRGEIVGGSFDPHTPIRNKISTAKKQFSACKEYPCIIILGKDGKYHPDPLFILAAMYGDLTLSIPIDGEGEISEQLGKNGSMVKPGTAESENTTITAIGVVGLICPDEKKSGYKKKLEELIKNYDINDEKQSKEWLKQANKLTSSLEGQGYNLGLFETEIDYVINPHARHKFPKKDLSKGFSVLREYSLKTGYFKITKTW